MKKLYFWENFSEEEKSLLGFGTALVLLLTLVFFAFVPIMEEALLAKEQCLDLQKRLAIYQGFAQKKGLSQFEEEQAQKLRALEKRLPKNLRQEDVMEELHAFAGASGVKLNSLKRFRQGVSKTQRLAFYMECSGEYRSVLNFLRAVEREGSLKILQELVVKGDEKRGNLELTAVVAAYKN